MCGDGVGWVDAAGVGGQAETPPIQPVPTPAIAEEEPAELPRAKLEDGVFLQSGEMKILDQDVQRVLVLMLTDEKKRNPKNIPSQERILRSRIEIAQVLLQNAVMIKFARDHKLETKKDELDKFIDLKKAEAQRDNSTFEQMLSDTGQTEAEFREFWGSKIAIETDISSHLTEKEVSEFFEKSKDELPLRSAAHILIQYAKADSAPKSITRTKEEAKALAEKILGQAKAGKSFTELANASEDEASKTNGGEMSFFPLKGEKSMVDSFGNAVYALKKIGDFTPVVESPFGFHVIKLTGIRDDEFKVEMRRYLAVKNSKN